MPDERIERVVNPNLLADAKARVGMLQKLDVLGRENPNSYTMSGLYALGVEL